MKLAILGTGMIVEDALPLLASIEGIELTAILSTARSIHKAQVLAQDFGIAQASSDYADILQNSQVDTVYVALPNHLHYAYSKDALLAGKHVICEKPFTMTGAELEELSQIAEQSGLILVEAITNQHLPNFHFMKEKLPELGDIKIVSCNYSQYSSRYDAFKRGEVAPAFDPAQGGGALRDLNIYNIHLVVGLFGRPESVHYLANQEREVDTSGILTMDYGRFKAVCIGAKDSQAERRSVLQGNAASLTLIGAPNAMPLVQFQVNNQLELEEHHNHHPHRMHDQFVVFRDLIKHQDLAKAREFLDHSRAVMAVLDQAVASSQ